MSRYGERETVTLRGGPDDGRQIDVFTNTEILLCGGERTCYVRSEGTALFLFKEGGEECRSQLRNHST